MLEYLPYGDLLGYLRKSRGIEDPYNTGEETKLNTHRKGPLVLCVDDCRWYELFVNNEGRAYHTYSVKASKISVRFKVMCDMEVMCYATFTMKLSDVVL